MRIEFFNLWSGKTGTILSDYLEERAELVDIFCFQEADKNFPDIAKKIFLKKFNEYRACKKNDEHDIFTQATFVRKNLGIIAFGKVLEKEANVGLGLMTVVRSSCGGLLTVVNFHGVSRPGDKLDSPSRLKQSRLLIQAFKSRCGKVVIGGDFNIEKETESANLFVSAGYDDLIVLREITNTRNRNVWERYPGKEQHYSSRIFTRGVKVLSIVVPQDNLASDHLPIRMEIE